MAKEEILEKVKEVRNAPSCYEGLKKVCDEYLAAAGTDKEAETAKKLKAELKEDVCSIDHVIPFFESEEGGQSSWRRYGKAVGKNSPRSEGQGREVLHLPGLHCRRLAAGPSG